MNVKMIAFAIALCVISVLILMGVLRHFQEGRFSYVNFERIRPGMTLPEVEGLLGSRSSTEQRVADRELDRVWYHHYDIWIESALLEIRVQFRDGKVVEARYVEPPFVF